MPTSPYTQLYHKERIKRWITQHKIITREQIAELCCVQKRTVDNWLSSSRRIPPACLKLIYLCIYILIRARRAGRKMRR